MFCEKCGKELYDGAKFCSGCGAEITVPENSAEAGECVTKSAASESVSDHNADSDAVEKERDIVKRNKKIIPLLIIGIAAVIAVICLITGVAVYSSPQRKLERQLSLGERYLGELDYENAIVAYRAALDIEPNNEAAMQGMADAYILYADSYAADDKYEDALKCIDEALADLPQFESLKNKQIDLYCAWAKTMADSGNWDEAIRILDDGYSAIGSEKINGLRSEYRKEKIKAAVLAVCRDFCEELAEYCANGEYEKAYTMLGTQSFSEITDTALANGMEDKLIVETSYDQVGIYPVQSEQYGDYMVYCGEYDNDEREGEGVWMGYKEGYFYYAVGEWIDDIPNGSWETREWNGLMDEEVTTRVITGNVTEGKWNGNITWMFTWTDGTFSGWYVEFADGFPVVTEDSENHYQWAEDTIEGSKDKGGLGSDNPPREYGIEGFYHRDNE